MHKKSLSGTASAVSCTCKTMPGCESVKLTVALPHHQRFSSRALILILYSFAWQVNRVCTLRVQSLCAIEPLKQRLE